MSCGLLKSLFETLIDPDRAPFAVGVNVMLTVQLAFGASEAGQLLVDAKSPLGVNVPITSVSVAEALLSRTVIGLLVVPTAWPANVNLLGANLIVCPIPCMSTVCGLPASLENTMRSPYRMPEVAGTKLTVILQVAPAATPVPQVFVWVKGPFVAMLEIVRAEFPVLVRVTV